MWRIAAFAVAAIAIAYAAPQAAKDEPKWRYWEERWPEGPAVYTPSQDPVSLPGLAEATSTRPSNSTHTKSSNTTSSVLTTITNPPGSLSAPWSNTTCLNSSATPVNACASIRLIALASSATKPKAIPTVGASLAYECINSVPFNQSAAVALIDSIRPYLQWQSTLQWIKDPPKEYAEKIQPPYDILAEFERIDDCAKAGSYLSEYEFGLDLYTCFQRTHDGHFVLFPDSITGIFAFYRTTPIVSVSKDGMSIPEIFAYEDILETTAGNATYKPSPIVRIDGQESTDFLLDWSQIGSLQDRDALWNGLFYNLAQVALGPNGGGVGSFAGGGRGRIHYPGPNTTLTFANGTCITRENHARVLQAFNNITSGQDIYKEYFIPPAESLMDAYQIATSLQASTSSSTTVSPTVTSNATMTSNSTVSATTATATPPLPAPGFPLPFIREGNNTNGGYFLEGEGYNDVAVLSVQSFLGTGEDQIPFQAINTYFINEAKARNKTKLIIDVSANGGGTILQGFDLFKQLFPQVLPYGGNRYRAHEAIDILGQEISEFSGRVENRSLDLNETALLYVATSWNYRSDVNINYTNFDCWDQKFGPDIFGPSADNYTSLQRWNLSDTLTTINSGGIEVSGYTNRSNITTQPFLTENIVIVTDGYCASTCTIFAELMKTQGGVKLINMGGRPNKNLTQAVGGVKGVNSLSLGAILYYALMPFQYQYIKSRDYYQNNTIFGKYNNLALYRTLASGINARDGFRQNDTSNVPLHFQYEPADCRIFYTPQMAVDMTAQWKTVADTAFNGINHCVAGTGFKSMADNMYGRPYKLTKRGLKKKQHLVRRDIDLHGHKVAIKNVWTGHSFRGADADGYMLP
ncbi:hypothetical protein CB0940_05763 [Cercospora beticola]|uniref:Uncharacterized protein n=1 Tax=Cercospora beticola TaxID=122368 RepID=A0A2G5HZF1_CERBT|nr:hypothetical protein CB0940_05763 [Cercospora beticola]PIA97917.1 hypothetical protein CB0940_05763 [Cercospora beticola]WPA98343.1 hypothetical protein RHO25_002955 [Cercospora beticola]